VWKSINHYDQLLKANPGIFIGDFNSNTIWDYKKNRLSNHSYVVEALEAKGTFSTYHIHHKQVQGQEQHPTYFMYRHRNKPYHIDYCFASAAMIEQLHSVEIGEYDAWIKYSDHVPVMIKFLGKN